MLGILIDKKTEKINESVSKIKSFISLADARAQVKGLNAPYQDDRNHLINPANHYHLFPFLAYPNCRTTS